MSHRSKEVAGISLGAPLWSKLLACSESGKLAACPTFAQCQRRNVDCSIDVGVGVVERQIKRSARRAIGHAANERSASLSQRTAKKPPPEVKPNRNDVPAEDEDEMDEVSEIDTL